jgi:hypothetical protein
VKLASSQLDTFVKLCVNNKNRLTFCFLGNLNKIPELSTAKMRRKHESSASATPAGCEVEDLL